ncbi:MAG: DUF1822 family protein [Leptolyngbya sp. SIO4C1]|nr:DUF1822 family protein [Leptolyngbya sp. SIO4C1]
MSPSARPAANIMIALTSEAHQLADRFCQRQSDLRKAEQVYFNTLAIWSVHRYLQRSGFTGDLSAGDSWDPLLQTCLDVADLSLPPLGKLECRPVLPGDTHAQVPAETWENRIGYVMIQLEETLESAAILGFVEQVTAETVPLSQLRPAAALVPYLQQRWPARLTQLRDWFNNKIDETWQTLDQLLSEPTPAFQFRSGAQSLSTDLDNLPLRTSRGKQLNLQPHPVALIVEATPADETVRLVVKVCPLGGQLYLPETLTLTIRDQQAQAVIQAVACGSDMVAAEFSGVPDERFEVEIGLGEQRVVEGFVI